MPEIVFGGDDDSNDSGGSGSFDIEEMMDQFETAQEYLMENPQLAKMLGIDTSELMPDMTEHTTTDSEGNQSVDVNSDFLEEMLDSLIQQGFGDKTVDDLHDFVTENKETVDMMIQQNLPDGEA